MIVSMSRQSLIALLHRATQVATERFAAAVGDSDLTARQLQILDTIEAHDGPSQTDIVNVTGIDRSTVADMMPGLSRDPPFYQILSYPELTHTSAPRPQ